MYTLKINPKMPHHYLVAVCMQELSLSKNPGQLFLKYKPIYLNHDDMERLHYATLLSNDKVFKTDKAKAIEIHNCQSIACTLSQIRIAILANQGSLHHFYTEHKFTNPEEFFKDFVHQANFNKKTRETLMSAKMRIYG